MHPKNRGDRQFIRRNKGMRRIRVDWAEHGGFERNPNKFICACQEDDAVAGRGQAFARFADYPKVCSCHACGNPRRSGYYSGKWRLTNQERRALDERE